MDLCYLDREEFPPIGELEHIEKRCFCYLCTCGSHKCPSVPTYTKPSVKITSSYREKFKGRQCLPSKPFKFLGEMRMSSQKMDLISMNQHEFQKVHEETLKKAKEPERQAVSSFKFYGKSTYQANYLRFNIGEQPKVGKTLETYSPLKFVAKSTYADQYITHGKVAENFEKVITNGNILNKGEFTLLDTTNSMTYVPHKYKGRLLPFRHSSMDYTSCTSPSPRFKSTYSSEFAAHFPKSMQLTLKQVELKRLSEESY